LDDLAGSVFAAAPYGAIGALIALAIMGTPFGFMAFLGVASLIGVIVCLILRTCRAVQAEPTRITSQF